MSIRPMKFPQEFNLVLQMIKDSFQYPENPDWNIQQDTLDSIDVSVGNLKKMWPLLKFLGIFSFQIRNTMRGYIWEENGAPAGLVTIHGQSKDVTLKMLGNTSLSLQRLMKKVEEVLVP